MGIEILPLKRQLYANIYKENNNNNKSYTKQKNQKKNRHIIDTKIPKCKYKLELKN